MATAFQPPPADLPLHKPEETDGRHGRLEPLFSLTSHTSATTTPGSLTRVKPVSLVVFTLKDGESRQLPFQSGRFTTVAQIMDAMLEALGLPKENVNAFSLWLTSKHLQLQLKPYHLPCKLFKRWRDLLSQYTNACYENVCDDEPILSFQRNAFFPLKEERKLIDPKKDYKKAIDLLYHEAVFNVTKARYPMSKDELHTLAGLQAAVYAAETGQQADSVSLRPLLVRFYPQHMFASDPKKVISRLFKQKSTTEVKTLDVQFDQAVQSAQQKSPDPHRLKILYLQLCWSKPFYGSVMFRGQIERPFNPVHILAYSDKPVTIALNSECLHIFQSTTPPDIMLFLTYDQLSWEFEPASEEGEDFYSSLWLEFDSVIATGGEERKVSKRLQIFSRQAPMMDAMISRCVSDIETREEQLRKMRVQQGGAEVLPEVCIKSDAPRVQKQERNYKENKLRCTAYSTEGQIVDFGGFTISRVLRKRGKQTVVVVQDPAEGTDGSGQGHPLTNMGRQRSATGSSQESRESLTGL